MSFSLNSMFGCISTISIQSLRMLHLPHTSLEGPDQLEVSQQNFCLTLCRKSTHQIAHFFSFLHDYHQTQLLGSCLLLLKIFCSYYYHMIFGKICIFRLNLFVIILLRFNATRVILVISLNYISDISFPIILQFGFAIIS